MKRNIKKDFILQMRNNKCFVKAFGYRRVLGKTIVKKNQVKLYDTLEKAKLQRSKKTMVIRGLGEGLKGRKWNF